MRILVVEDNQKLAQYIKKALKQKSYSVDLAFDGQSGEDQIRAGEYDVVILDVMLPGITGLEVCKRLRADSINLPIIMLTARGELDDKVAGLDSGADDYLVKPFKLEELLARLRALLKRPTRTVSEVLQAQDISLDSSNFTAKKADQQLELTLKEYSVLEYLLRNKGMTLTREQLLDHCWDYAYDSFSNIVDVYIKQLRKKLADKDETYIKTVRGVGYRLQV